MVFKSLPSLFWQGIKPSPWIHIVHIKPGLLDIVGKPSYLAYLGYLAIWAIWNTRFVITLGVMGILFTFPPIFGMIEQWQIY